MAGHHRPRAPVKASLKEVFRLKKAAGGNMK